MTNLILTIIGVVLATISALIAFDYGGDYFVVGYQRAQATAVSNAGENVAAAYSVFTVQQRRAPNDLAELVSSPQGRSLLKAIPEVNGLGTIRTTWMGVARPSATVAQPDQILPAFVVEGISPELCRSLNQRINGFAEDAPIPVNAARSRGCYNHGGSNVFVYYSFLDKVASSNLATYVPSVAPWPMPISGGSSGGSGGGPAPITVPVGTVDADGWTLCALQGNRCAFTGDATVRYGFGGAYAFKLASDGIDCTTEAIGSDPWSQVSKACWYKAGTQPEAYQAAVQSIRAAASQVASASAPFWGEEDRTPTGFQELVPEYLPVIPTLDPQWAGFGAFTFASAGDTGLIRIGVVSEGLCIALNTTVNAGFAGRIIPPGSELAVPEGCYRDATVGLVFARTYRKAAPPAPEPTPTPTPTPTPPPVPTEIGTVFDMKAMFREDNNDRTDSVWSYLEDDPSAGTPRLLTTKGGCFAGPCVRGGETHVTDTKVDQISASSILRSDSLSIHPGSDRDVIIRFRAPYAGWFKVRGSFAIADTSPTGIDVDWGQGFNRLDSQTLSRQFNYNRYFAAGERLDFRLDRAGDYRYDGTSIKGSLTFLGATEPPPPVPGVGSHRYWRILAHRSGGDGLVAASEIEFRATPGGEDLTGGGTVIASASYGGGYEARNAFDDNLGTPYASPSGYDGNIDHWIGYDFGSGNGVDVKEIAWRSRSDGYVYQTIGSGELQWSDDGSNWDTSFAFTLAPASSAGQLLTATATVVTDPDAHRFWRVRGFSLNDPYMRASEVEFAETVGGVNRARFGIPFSSSQYSGAYDRAFAFNGGTGGNHWASAGFTYGQEHITVDLLIPRNIQELRYAPAEGYKAPTSFVVEWSDDNENFTEAWRVSYSAWRNDDLISFPRSAPQPPAVGLATSVIVYGAGYDSCMQIAEIEVYSGRTNVALASAGATASGSPSYDAASAVRNVNDGVKPAGYPNIYHSQCSNGNFVRIDFATPVSPDAIVIYGRADCCTERDIFVYNFLDGDTVISRGKIDARRGSGAVLPIPVAGATSEPTIPTANSSNQEQLAYMSWIGAEWRRLAHSMGYQQAFDLLRPKVLNLSANVTGMNYEWAGWYSRYGFSSPEPYIYFTLRENSPNSQFCADWVALRPEYAGFCDNYYGNHITFYLY